MKYLDEVRLVVDKEKYSKLGIKKGWTGTIIESYISFLGTKTGCFDIAFHPPGTWEDILVSASISDIELVKESEISDTEILEDLPNNDPTRYCKVVDGYIVNLRGERLNKIPYNYTSWGKGYED